MIAARCLWFRLATPKVKSSVDTFERQTRLEWELPRVAVAVGARAGLQV